jgi:hypothetical protein
MKFHRKYKNLAAAFAILAVYIVIVALLFYPGSAGLGGYFNLSVLLIFTYYIAITTGIVLLLLRLFKWYKDRFSLIYILAGTLNLCLAFAGFVLYYVGKADMTWLHNSFGNLFIGFLFFADTFILFPAKD